MALSMRRTFHRPLTDRHSHSHSHSHHVPAKLVQPVCRRRDNKSKSDQYRVTLITPPPKNLGIHCLPPNTQCGETVTVSGESYIVSGVVYQYQLKKGKYTPSVKKLEVQQTGRYILNMYLDDLLRSS